MSSVIASASTAKTLPASTGAAPVMAPPLSPHLPPPHLAARQELMRFPADAVLLVALDIGKDVNVVMMRSLDGNVLTPPTKLLTLASGYVRFWELLRSHLATNHFSLVVIGHEPTGVYHEAWAHHLTHDLAAFAQQTPLAPPIRYRLLQPTLVKRARQQASHRQRKSDAIDTFAIADVLAAGHGHAPLHLSDSEYEMRLVASTLNSFLKERKRLAAHLLRTLDRLWPGALGDLTAFRRTHPDLPLPVHLVDSRPLERIRIHLLLTHAVTPHQLIAWGVHGICDFFHAHDVTCGPKTASLFLSVAQQCLLPPTPVADLLARRLQVDFARFLSLEQQIEHEEARLVALLPASHAAICTSVPGLSPLLVARFFASLGDLTRFESPAQIWAFAGLDPVQHDSGNHRASGSLSKRGSSVLRYLLYQMGLLVAQHCPDLIRLYHVALQRGKSKTLAILHVANKLLRTLWRLIQTQKAYCSPLTEAEQQHWLLLAQQRRQRHPR